MYGVPLLKMHRSRPAIAALLAVVATLLTALTAPAAADERGLSARLGGAMGGAGGWSGAYVYNADSGRPVFAWRHTAPRILASNTKLFTTAAALARFGTEGKLATEVRGGGQLGDRGVYRGNLYLVGGGDPSFGSQSFTGRAYGGGATVEALAAQVERAGIERVTGRVLGDESAFDGLRGGPDSGYGLSPWVGPLSALGYNRGLSSEGGYGFQAAPPAFVAARLTDALRRRGIAVSGSPASGRAPVVSDVLAAVESPSMTRLAALTNKPSDNYFAEMLVKALAMKVQHGVAEDEPRQRRVVKRGTTAGGAKIAARFAKRLGGGPARLADGSGLSRLNRASPQRVVKLLLALRERDEWPAFDSSLSIAGRDGTLGPRMRSGPARSRCRGKTGTLTGRHRRVGLLPRALGPDLRLLDPDERDRRLPRPRRSRTACCRRSPASASRRPEQLEQPRLVDHLDAELLGLRELRPGVGAGDDVVGLLRHRAGDLAAGRLDPLLSPRRGSGRAACRSGRTSCPSAGPRPHRRRSLLLELQPVRAQPLDQLARRLLAERLGDLLGEDRPDPRDLLDLLRGGGEQRVDRCGSGRSARARLRRRSPWMPSPNSTRWKGCCFERSIAATQVARRVGAEPLQLDQLLLGQVVDAGDPVDDAGAQELQHPLLAEPLDVHRATADELLDGLEQLAGAAGAVRADRPDAALRLDRRRAAGRALDRRTSAPARAPCASAPWVSARPRAGSRRRHG